MCVNWNTLDGFFIVTVFFDFRFPVSGFRFFEFRFSSALA
jgi:hypothetical protein